VWHLPQRPLPLKMESPFEHHHSERADLRPCTGLPVNRPKQAFSQTCEGEGQARSRHRAAEGSLEFRLVIRTGAQSFDNIPTDGFPISTGLMSGSVA
jgi:hypothetical protein